MKPTLVNYHLGSCSFPLTPGKGLFPYIQDFASLVLVLVVLFLVFFLKHFVGFLEIIGFCCLVFGLSSSKDVKRVPWMMNEEPGMAKWLPLCGCSGAQMKPEKMRTFAF